MRTVVQIFKALSDANRLRILKMLEIRPLCVCEISEVLQLANSTVSRHLSILRNAELILDSKDGKWVNYALNSTMEAPFIRQVLPMIAEWLPDDAQVRSDAQKVRLVNRETICGR